MFKPLPLFVGLRYTRAKRRNHFISFISLTSMTGLTLGVMVLIVVLSVMNGFDRELKQRILGMVPHATISAAYGSIEDWQPLIEGLKQREGVLEAAPFINNQGMLSAGGRVKGSLIYGIEPRYEKHVSIVDEHFKEGSLELLQSGEFRIILGDILARQLGLRVGDKVTLVLPEATTSPAGVFPRLKRFTLAGTFSVGAELDSNLAMIHIEDAARLKRMANGVEGIRLLTDNLFKAPRIAWDAANAMPGRYYVRDWTQTHGSLFQAIKMEKTMVGLLLTLIIAVAAFNIVATLVMVVTDKQSDIAILRTFGATSNTIMGIFMVQGSVIGIFGTLLGVLLGVLLAPNIPELVSGLETLLGTNFLSSDVYFISYLPSKLEWSDVGMVASAGLSMSFLATLYPAYRASRTEPAEALRYE
ncbi:lipoprotein-releasing ABC transporter permease subunit [Aestuariirhabdus sp. Z084]|uniref:lipoprotein-releasing ABC transporter permease subunit n=1 Tax=Aestuariirhabdus haliotis TaxID=2918751 RepID=UPI00201B352E|nr:lipoprotein-releasing ABC transporter permease subunit [Aestuariirhabdus haliotis]MCL6414775.1 lipoprotein-releasing ABC transporter permease subunit [Aestuariirhabdus haliotis]MCL6418707.1 lipoprotein-releasing ABC transporter permease subunit [Aestuariirhabdus haliotis]